MSYLKMLNVVVSLFNISSEFVQTFVLSVNKLLNVWGKEWFWLMSKPLTNVWLHRSMMQISAHLAYSYTKRVLFGIDKHLLPYTGCISEWIRFAH